MSVFVHPSPRSLELEAPAAFGSESVRRLVPPAGAGSWRLDRNCSMSPRCLACVLGLLAAASLGIGLFFTWNGAWLVLPFALIEVAVLAAAFVVYARRATDGDRLWFDGGSLVVERETSGQVSQRLMQAAWVDVRLDSPQAQALTVQCGREAIEIGQWASAARREQVWKEMRLALAERRRLAAG
jgi:uncharacterized membrane protein